MQTYRLLYFRESVLEGAREVEARNAPEAIAKASGEPDDVRVEVWSKHRRVAIVRRTRG